MYFQKVLKGINGLTNRQADEMLANGILCNWWRRVGQITPSEILDNLSERNLDWHLNHYDDPDPLENNRPFRENTPYISATAGAVERDAFLQRNFVYDPFVTALRFATDDFRSSGHIFYAYVFTLGRQSIELSGFAEEVRELNVYKNFMPYHPEGEITAKIEIGARQIEKWEAYDGPAALKALQRGNTPAPVASNTNRLHASPARYCNIRGLVTD